jgi:hypothetical protein
MKKYLMLLLIFSLMFQLAGCYSYQEITKTEFIEAEDYMDLKVITKNQHTYEFDEGDYIVKEDSIYGNGKMVNIKLYKKEYKDFSGSIYLGDIQSFKFDSFDALSTILGIAAIVGIIVYVVSSVNVSLGGWGPSGSGNSL